MHPSMLIVGLGKMMAGVADEVHQRLSRSPQARPAILTVGENQSESWPAGQTEEVRRLAVRASASRAMIQEMQEVLNSVTTMAPGRKRIWFVAHAADLLAGALVDAACAARSAAPAAIIRAVVLMPPPGEYTVRGRAYATLRELRHVLEGGAWRDRRCRQPFHTAYLMQAHSHVSGPAAEPDLREQAAQLIALDALAEKPFLHESGFATFGLMRYAQAGATDPATNVRILIRNAQTIASGQHSRSVVTPPVPVLPEGKTPLQWRTTLLSRNPEFLKPHVVFPESLYVEPAAELPDRVAYFVSEAGVKDTDDRFVAIRQTYVSGLSSNVAPYHSNPILALLQTGPAAMGARDSTQAAPAEVTATPSSSQDAASADACRTLAYLVFLNQPAPKPEELRTHAYQRGIIDAGKAVAAKLKEIDRLHCMAALLHYMQFHSTVQPQVKQGAGYVLRDLKDDFAPADEWDVLEQLYLAMARALKYDAPAVTEFADKGGAAGYRLKLDREPSA